MHARAAQKTEFITITISIPDVCYMPFFKYSKGVRARRVSDIQRDMRVARADAFLDS